MQGKTTCVHIQNVQLQPLRCDRLLLHKIPLKYIIPRLQDATLSADLTDFNGNFVCILPENMKLEGHLETDEKQDIIRFSTHLKNDKSTLLTSTGSLKDFYLLHNTQLAMECEGKIDLPFFDFLLPGHLKGVIQAKFKAQGPLHQLNMTGKMNVTEGAYEDPQQGIILHNGRAHIDFQNNKIILKEFYVDDHSQEKGSITAQGAYDMATDKGLIKANIQNFQPLHYNPIYMRISGPITVHMSPQLEINGKFIARNVLVNYDQF